MNMIRKFILVIRFLVLIIALFPLSEAIESCKSHPAVEKFFEKGFGEMYYLHMISIYLITTIPVFYALGNVKSKSNIIFSSSLFSLGLILYIVTFFYVVTV